MCFLCVFPMKIVVPVAVPKPEVQIGNAVVHQVMNLVEDPHDLWGTGKVSQGSS